MQRGWDNIYFLAIFLNPTFLAEWEVMTGNEI